MTAKEELVKYVESLTPEDTKKLLEHLPLLKRLLDMEEPELVYTQTFLRKMFAEQVTQ